MASWTKIEMKQQIEVKVATPTRWPHVKDQRSWDAWCECLKRGWSALGRAVIFQQIWSNLSAAAVKRGQNDGAWLLLLLQCITCPLPSLACLLLAKNLIRMSVGWGCRIGRRGVHSPYMNRCQSTLGINFARAICYGGAQLDRSTAGLRTLLMIRQFETFDTNQVSWHCTLIY